MAAQQVSRAEFTALTQRIAALEKAVAALKQGSPTGPTGASGPTGPTGATGSSGGITTTAPAVNITGSRYALSAIVTAAQVTSFTYLQLAVRGPGAADLALSPGATLAAGASTTLSASASGSGDYTAWVAYSLDGTTWVDGAITRFSVSAPVTPTPNTKPTGEGKIKLAGLSGLSFNSIVFRQSAAAMRDFGARRGVAMDGILYFTPRQSWNDFMAIPDDVVALAKAGGLVVITMPHAPESEGDAMNQKGANDAYKANQRAIGAYLNNRGMNLPNVVVRVDWESNGTWYHWSANRPGGAPALKSAIATYVTNLRAGGATQVAFDLCWNKGPSQAGADFAVFPGAEYIDVVAVDQYDMWSPAYSASDWEREMAKSPSIRTVAKFAAQNGIQWAIDEGGNTHGDSNQGGDNPWYWQCIRQEIANNPGNAWHNTYDDPGAPATLMHDFAHNPNSWVKYKQLWTPA